MRPDFCFKTAPARKNSLLVKTTHGTGVTLDRSNHIKQTPGDEVQGSPKRSSIAWPTFLIGAGCNNPVGLLVGGRSAQECGKSPKATHVVPEA